MADFYKLFMVKINKIIKKKIGGIFLVVADKSHRVIVALSYNYTMRYIGYDSFQTVLSNSHSNVVSIQKDRGDESHRVIAALARKLSCLLPRLTASYFLCNF